MDHADSKMLCLWETCDYCYKGLETNPDGRGLPLFDWVRGKLDSKEVSAALARQQSEWDLGSSAEPDTIYGVPF